MNKLSVVTINFNDKIGLEKTITSVIHQSYAYFEYIVIDGNSTDGSKELLENYGQYITYSLSEPDSGIYNAMNKGIKVANGEYLLFLNSGDYLVDNDVLTRVGQFIDGTYDLYYGDAIFKDNINEQIVKYPNKLSFHFFTYNNLCHQATFIKKSLFETVFYYNENFKIISDWEFLIYAICIKNCTYKHIDEIICYYDFEGISSKDNSKDLIAKETKIVMNNYFSAFIEDYKIIEEFASKRVKNLIYIKKFPLAWKILKGFSNIILLFLPKQK